MGSINLKNNEYAVIDSALEVIGIANEELLHLESFFVLGSPVVGHEDKIGKRTRLILDRIKACEILDRCGVEVEIVRDDGGVSN